MENYLQLGKIVKTVGLKGEIKVFSSTFFASKRYKKGNILYLGDENKIETKVEVISYRPNGNLDIVKFKDYESIELAETLINKYIYVEKDRNFLGKDEYFFDDLIGCKVYQEVSKELLGSIESVGEYPGQMSLIIKKLDGKTFNIPFIDYFVKKVDIENKEIFIHVIDGLL